MDDSTKNMFTAADYALFIACLTVPSFIGVYFAWKDWETSSTSKYFFGEKRMHPVAIGISTAVTSISALTMIGYPAEVYLVGTVFFWTPLAIINAAAITLVYYVPLYIRLQLDTIYGYLGLRFNSTVRRIVAAMVMLSEIFFMGIITYLPAIALNAVASTSINLSIVAIGGVCTFYTTLGGMQAVVWTDVLQSIFMMFGSIMLLVNTVITVGGFGEVTAALERGNRTTFLKFENFDISSRIHPIAVFVGEFFVFTKYLGFSQPIYQRILSCKNLRQSQYSILAYVIPAMLIICLSVCNGLVMYAYFEGCDPLKNGAIEHRDQGIPYMAVTEFSRLPGMTGIFVAAVFSGTLSTISSGLNAYSAVIVEDFAILVFPRMSDKKKLFLGKLSAALLGIFVVCFAYVISIIGQSTLKILRGLAGAISGSVLGIYVLGIFLPWANSLGAVLGGSVAYVTMVWIFVGSNVFLTAPPRVELPPISVDKCPVKNITQWNSTALSVTSEPYSATTIHEMTAVDSAYTFDQMIYSLNFHYYVMVGCILTIVIGLLVSLISGCNNPSNMDPKLFVPIFDNVCLPEKLRRLFRCGVPPVPNDVSAEPKRNRNHSVAEDDLEMTALTA